MIADVYYEEVEYAYRVRKVFYSADVEGIDSVFYLPAKLRQFCLILGIHPSTLFNKSRKPEVVQYRCAFTQYLPSDFSPTRLARFLNFDHSTVYHWRGPGHEQFLGESDYIKILTKLGIHDD